MDEAFGTATRISAVMCRLPNTNWSLRDLIAATQSPRESYKPALDLMIKGRLIEKNTDTEGVMHYKWIGKSVVSATR